MWKSACVGVYQLSSYICFTKFLNLFFSLLLILFSWSSEKFGLPTFYRVHEQGTYHRTFSLLQSLYPPGIYGPFISLSVNLNVYLRRFQICLLRASKQALQYLKILLDIYKVKLSSYSTKNLLSKVVHEF